MGYNLSQLSTRPYSEALQARQQRQDNFVSKQPMNDNEGTLLCLIGDMVSDPKSYDTTINYTYLYPSVARMARNNFPDYFIALGDNVYQNGEESAFFKEYHDSYGQMYDRSFFVIGNHEIMGVLDPYQPTPYSQVVSGGTLGSDTITLTKIPPMLSVGDYIAFQPIAPNGTNVFHNSHESGEYCDVHKINGEVRVGQFYALEHARSDRNPWGTIGQPVIAKTVKSIDYENNTVTMTNVIYNSEYVVDGWAAFAQNGAHGYKNYAGFRAGKIPSDLYKQNGWFHARNFGRYRLYMINANIATGSGDGGGGYKVNSSVSSNTITGYSTHPQWEWLLKDIENHPDKAIIATWHHPRWGDSAAIDDQWQMSVITQMLQATGRCIAIITGHDHNYQRFNKAKDDNQNWDSVTNKPIIGSQILVNDPVLDQEGYPTYFISGAGGEASAFDFGISPDNQEGDRHSFGLANRAYAWYGGALFLKLTSEGIYFEYKTVESDPRPPNDDDDIFDPAPPLYGTTDLNGPNCTGIVRDSGFIPIFGV